MINALHVKIGNKDRKVFLQERFYNNTAASSKTHKHKYAEVHIISSDATVVNIEGKKHVTKNDVMLVIPGGCYHSIIFEGETCFYTGFQIDLDIKKFSIHKISPDILSSLKSEIVAALKNGDHTGIAAHISFLSRHFFGNDKTLVTPITDYGFLINEFFSMRYSEDVHLSDLAEELHLSIRQTERLVIEHTGKTFKDALVTTRINTAKYLIDHMDLPLTDIAEYVGYSSYSGFWKAIKKHIKA